jgi:aldose 1-epimerase
MIRRFGRLPDGQEVEIATLGSKDGLQAEILTLGGTLRSLSLPLKDGKRIQLVLSFPELDSYLRDTSYVGQLVGRYGNRIAGAAFELDGKQYKLTANSGSNTLHGGDVGFGKYLWKVLGSGGGKNTYVKLGHHSPAGINGFPGNLDVTALISVYENTLTLAYEATTDAPTPISLTWHPYFTLSGDPRTSTDEQRLTIAASHYLPVNEARVPTGEIAPVAGTPFDFRKTKSVRVPPSSNPQIALTSGYDHCWVLDQPSPSPNGPVAAELYSPASGVHMQVKTNLPGLQVYDASHFKTAYPGLHAICVEPENFPDAPNHANFPSSILRPGEPHRSYMSFGFSI